MALLAGVAGGMALTAAKSAALVGVALVVAGVVTLAVRRRSQPRIRRTA